MCFSAYADTGWLCTHDPGGFTWQHAAKVSLLVDLKTVIVRAGSNVDQAVDNPHRRQGRRVQVVTVNRAVVRRVRDLLAGVDSQPPAVALIVALIVPLGVGPAKAPRNGVEIPHPEAQRHARARVNRGPLAQIKGPRDRVRLAVIDHRRVTDLPADQIQEVDPARVIVSAANAGARKAVRHHARQVRVVNAVARKAVRRQARQGREVLKSEARGLHRRAQEADHETLIGLAPKAMVQVDALHPARRVLIANAVRHVRRLVQRCVVPESLPHQVPRAVQQRRESMRRKLIAMSPLRCLIALLKMNYAGLMTR
jgi:hypothetical protein